MRTTSVHHWHYDNGWHDIPCGLIDKNNISTNDKYFNEELVGWHCWVYEAEGVDISEWMKQNMKGKFDCTLRFNSGDPMHTIWIKDDEDATLFKLKWM